MAQPPAALVCPIRGCSYHCRTAGQELSAAEYDNRLQKHFRQRHKQFSFSPSPRKRPSSSLESIDPQETLEASNSFEATSEPILGPDDLNAEYHFVQQSLQLLGGAHWDHEDGEEGYSAYEGEREGVPEEEEDEVEEEEEEEEQQQSIAHSFAEPPKIPPNVVFPAVADSTMPVEAFIITEWGLYPGFGEFQKLKTLISVHKFKQLQFLNGLTQEKQQEFITLTTSLGLKDGFKNTSEFHKYQNAFLQTLPIYPLQIFVTRKKFKETRQQTVGVHKVTDIIADEYLEALDRKAKIHAPGQVADGAVISHIMNSKWGEKMKNHFTAHIEKGT